MGKNLNKRNLSEQVKVGRYTTVTTDWTSASDTCPLDCYRFLFPTQTTMYNDTIDQDTCLRQDKMAKPSENLPNLP